MQSPVVGGELEGGALVRGAEPRLHALFCPAPCFQPAAPGPRVSLATAVQRLPEGASVSPRIPPLAPLVFA